MVPWIHLHLVTKLWYFMTLLFDPDVFKVKLAKTRADVFSQIYRFLFVLSINILYLFTVRVVFIYLLTKYTK